MRRSLRSSPVGHRHSRDDLLAGAVATAFDEGLSQLTFGRVARRLGVSDRIVVYYFPTKDALISEVLAALGLQLQLTLAPAFASPATDHLELARTAWPILARPTSDPVFALYFEAIGLAASGREPYRTLVPGLFDAWVEWTASLLSGTRAQRRAEAEATIAVLDGLLLVRHTAGAASAARAARRLGVA